MISIDDDFVIAAENYLGCFKHQNEVELHRENLYFGDTMTPEVCTTLCGRSGNLFAHLKAGTQCYCSALPPPASSGDNIAENLCDVPCSGKPGLSCGGIGYAAVYSALKTSDYVYPSFTLTIPSVVNLGENVSFSVSALPESNYFIDFGNGDTMRSRKTDMFYTFATAGKFTVRASSVTSEYGEPSFVSAEAEVLVKLPLVATLVCPPTVETNEEFECTLDVIQSSNVGLSLDFFDGIPPESDLIKGM